MGLCWNLSSCHISSEQMAKLLKAGTEIRRLKGTTFTKCNTWPACLNEPHTREPAPKSSFYLHVTPMLLGVGLGWRAETHPVEWEGCSWQCAARIRISKAQSWCLNTCTWVQIYQKPRRKGAVPLDKGRIPSETNTMSIALLTSRPRPMFTWSPRPYRHGEKF